jgi:hypothetical protein
MVEILLCGFIAQQCSVLASSSLTVLFIADVAPRAAGELMTLSPRGNGVCSLCIIKGDDITLSDSRRLCRLCIMMPEPRRRGHMATVIPSISGQLVVFWVARESPTTVDPLSCSLCYITKTDPMSEGSAPNLTPLRRRLHDLLL